MVNFQRMMGLVDLVREDTFVLQLQALVPAWARLLAQV